MTRGPRNFREISLAFLVAAFGEGCESTTPDLPDVIWDNAQFKYAADLDEYPCDGTLESQADFVRYLQAIFGPAVDGRRFTYYELDEESFAEAVCPDAGACYTSGRIYSQDPLNFHEIVHAVVDLAFGSSHRFFSEGIAEVFRDRHGGGLSLHGSVLDGLAPGDGQLPYELYGRAGHFMAYFLDTFGMEATLTLLKRARPGQTVDELEAALEAATGMPFTVLLEHYADYPICDNLNFRLPLTECAAEPLEWNGCFWQAYSFVECNVEGALGVRDGQVWTTRALSIPSDGVYRVNAFGDPGSGAFMELGKCEVGCGNDSYLRLERGEETHIHLNKGEYYISLVRSAGAPGLMGVRVAPTEGSPEGCVP